MGRMRLQGQVPPTEPPVSECLPIGQDNRQGCGIPDLCLDGYTILTVSPCAEWNPTPHDACQNLEWRDALLICQTIPLDPPPRLSQTGTASAPIAGTGLMAVVAGVVLLRIGRRIA